MDKIEKKINIRLFVDANVWESHNEDNSAFTKDKNVLLRNFLLFIDILYLYVPLLLLIKLKHEKFLAINSKGKNK